MVANDKERQVGRDNFNDAATAVVTRRQLLQGTVVAAGGLTGFYWGYGKLKGEPVRVGVIGTGDQGKAHIRSSNPDFMRIVAFTDIRPSNIQNTRLTLDDKYGPRDSKKVRFYEKYQELLADPDVEMVIIALPLHLHAPVAIAAMRAGKHVLCEKLMAKTVTDGKEMVREGIKNNRFLAIGHQRHYSYLYANALEIIQQDILGDVKHIRAFWHRNQTGNGSPDAETGKYDSWRRQIPKADEDVDWAEYGYKSLEELISWRLHARTGGGLLVELGSHQLDACSIFLNKQHPVAVQGMGMNSFFTDGREVEDHIFLMYEFPKQVIVTYSSIGTNALDSYGEYLMGTKGSLILEAERNVYLFKEGASKDTRITWAEQRIGQAQGTTTSTTQWVSGVGTPDTLTSRGYREEQEHLCWLIREGADPRNFDAGGQPRCNGKVALADAIITLASNVAMREKRRIEFQDAWFDVDSEEAPDPTVANTFDKV